MKKDVNMFELLFFKNDKLTIMGAYYCLLMGIGLLIGLVFLCLNMLRYRKRRIIWC